MRLAIVLIGTSIVVGQDAPSESASRGGRHRRQNHYINMLWKKYVYTDSVGRPIVSYMEAILNPRTGCYPFEWIVKRLQV